MGQALCRRIGPLDRLNIPAPVIGGLLAALAVLCARLWDLPVIQFDTTPQRPLMVAYFTTLGFVASVRLLRRGGPQVALLLAIATVFLILQNIVGAAVATAFGLHPLFGVLTGSVTLAGGPATGLAFAPLFEQAGVTGAAPIATATAMAGIVLGGLVGAPIATLLIERYRLRPAENPGIAGNTLSATLEAPAPPPEQHGAEDAFRAALKAIALILIAMWAGTWISRAIEHLGVTLPAYIGGMIAASIVRNVDDATGWLRLPHAAIDFAGAIALSLFLVMAMMTLDLFQLSNLAAPLLVGLAAQLVMVLLFIVWPLHALMGRDYDAAVTCGGFAGFMLGTTANAVAVMRALVECYGPAPRAFLVAPLVGAFFLDFTNALVITACLNLFA